MRLLINAVHFGLGLGPAESQTPFPSYSLWTCVCLASLEKQAVRSSDYLVRTTGIWLSIIA